jgi:two-component system, NtrC family, sensor kinase
VARQWRLRSKLLLGLGIVVTSVALLVSGTVLGLTSYVSTMNTQDSKLRELSILDELKIAIHSLNTPYEKSSASELVDSLRNPPRGDEPRRLKGKLQLIKRTWENYKAQFLDTVQRGRDPDPYQEKQLITDVEPSIAQLEKSIRPHIEMDLIASNDPTPPSIASDPKVLQAQIDLIAVVDEVRSAILGDMYHKIGDARIHYKRSMWVLGVATGVAIILTLTLMHLFKGWVFKPLKELQAGVRRVYSGDFKHPIQVKSGDELEELAVALNASHQKLHQQNLDLERQVDERSRQLVRSERLASVGFLAAGVAHEINNPLASIAFCSEALQSRLRDYLQQHPKDSDVIAKYLSMIQQEAFRCKGITSKLLEFSRVGERRRERADLSELIQSVLEISQHLQNCRGKRIVFQPLERVVAGVNAEDVKSVVLNLVVNALDSMDEGGTLTITLQQRTGIAELVFVDTGCGMNPDILKNIFEPFFTKSRSGKGTGLGLFISHHIVDQHGGEISAASAGPNQGSTFTVRIPLEPAQTAEVKGKEADTIERDAVLSFERGQPKIGTGTSGMEDGLGHAAA